MDVKPHQATDLEQLCQMSRQEHNAKQRDRYRAVLLALEGQSTEAIMHILDRSKNFVQRWVYAYRDRGLPTIHPKVQSGRPSKLKASQEARFKQRFLGGPTPADGVCTLRAKEARRILQEEFGVHYTLAGIYDLLHRLNLSCLTPRPRHRKNDPQKMQQWLEQAPLLSTASANKSLINESKCGSKMRPASASKEP